MANTIFGIAFLAIAALVVLINGSWSLTASILVGLGVFSLATLLINAFCNKYPNHAWIFDALVPGIVVISIIYLLLTYS